jgi:Holliday junction resolvase
MSLERRIPLRAQPRAKGNRAEREVIDLLHEYGWKSARRNFQSGGQGGGDIIAGPTDVHVEVKHRERAAIWEWISQAESEARPTDIPLVAFRRNRSQWYAAVPLDEFLALVKLRETGASAVKTNQPKVQ